MFVGTFEHSLDDKGRVVLPALFRHYLADRGFLSQYDQCIGLWTPEGFESMATRLTEHVRAGEASQFALRAFAANAQEVKPDSQGRIMVPERLREFAALKRDVVIIGALDRVEIWDAARWREAATGGDESLTRAVTDLGI